jgi:hypothetical protein
MTKCLRKTVTKEKHFIWDYGFKNSSLWSHGPVAFGPVVKQNIMAEASGGKKLLICSHSMVVRSRATERERERETERQREREREREKDRSREGGKEEGKKRQRGQRERKRDRHAG